MTSPEDEGGEVGGEDAEALHAKAGELLAEGKLPEAEAVFRTIVREVKARLGKDHPGHGAALYELSRVLSAQSKYAEAEGLLRRALALFEEDPGVDQAPYGQTLHTLAGVLVAQDKHREAEEVLRAGLAAQEKAVGPAHVALAPTLTNLAVTLVQQQRIEEAEPVVLRSLEIAEEHFGEAHQDTARVLTILAQVQASLGKEEASATARRALTALKAVHGADHPLVQDAEPILMDIAEPNGEVDAALHTAAEALEGRDVDRAVALLRPLVERARREGLLPLEASAGGMLAQALYVKGSRDEALVLAARSLEIAEAAGQEDAASHFRELVEAMSRAEGGASVPKDVHDRIQAAIETAQRGDVTSAIGSLDALAEEVKAADDGGSEATVRIVLGQILQAVGNRDGATAHLRRALTIAEAIGDQGAADHVRRMLETA